MYNKANDYYNIITHILVDLITSFVLFEIRFVSSWVINKLNIYFPLIELWGKVQ